MPFLPPNQQRQSTEGKLKHKTLKHTNIKITMNIITQAGKFRLKFKKLESHVSKRSDLDLTVFILFGRK